MVFTGAEIAVLKKGLRKAASAVGKAALTGPGPGAGSVEKRTRTSRIPGRERRKKTIEADDAERFGREIVKEVSGQRFTLPGKVKPQRLEIPAADIDRLVAGIGVLMTALPGGQVDMALVLKVHGEPEKLADRMRTAMPQAAEAVGDQWAPVLDELAGIVCEHIVEFFTTRESFGAATGLELLKQSARGYQPEEEAELLAAYERLVREKSHRIRLFGLDLHEDDQSYDLMTGFVELTIEASAGSGASGPDRDGVRTGRANWNRLDALVHEHRRILLEGPAGSGKSTLTQWLALTCLTRAPSSSAPKSLVPFLIRLREFTGSQALRLPQPSDFLKTLTPSLAGPPQWEPDLLRTGRAAILVDGIDEIPEQLRDEALDWLQNLVIAYPRAYVVVTTRPAGLAESWRRRLVDAQNFTRATINPMSAEQVSRFIDRWHEAAADRPHADPAELQECAASLKQAIRLRRDLSRITTTPLLCAMVCALYRADNRALPRNRTALYERAYAMLLEKRDTQQKIQTFPVQLAREQIEPFLTEIALWMLMNEQRSISGKIALGLVEDLLPRLQVPDPPKSWKLTAEELLRHLVVRSGVLQEPTMEFVEFVHPSFQDFLAAKRVFQKAYLPYLIKNAHDAMYQDVAIMAVSQVQNDRDQQNELLERLIERAKTDRKQSRQLYLLAAACVADAAMVDPKWVKLVRAKTRSLLPPQSTREAQVLAAAGEFTLDLLADVERTRKFSVPEAEATVEAIGLMGGGGEVGTRILRALAERYGKRVGPELITAWHQAQDPQAFRDEVLAYGDFSRMTVTINSPHLLEFLDKLPGLDRLSLGTGIVKRPLLDLRGLTISAVRATKLPDYTCLEELTLDHAPVTALHDIERFPDLTVVEIRNTPEPELVDLTTLPMLTTLIVIGAKRVQLEPLTAIPTLVRLTLRASEPVDLTPLADLWNLEDLSVTPTDIKSHKPLPHITSLDIDDLHNGIAGMFPGLNSVKALMVTAEDDALAGLTRLTKLTVIGEDVSDFGALAAIPHLNRLDLWRSRTDDTTGLTDLRIEEFSLVDSTSRRLAILEQTPQLRSLRLNRVPGGILAKLPALPRLTNLDLWNVSQPALAKLGGAATQISHLSLAMAEDTDLQGLTALPSLTHLELSNTHAFDMAPLRHLPDLEKLSIYYVKHYDRSVLRYLSGLKSLYIDGDSPIDPTWLPPEAALSLLNPSRLTPADLAALPTLRGLTLSELPECGLAALAVVPTIEHLRLTQLAGVRAVDLAEWPALRSLDLSNTPGMDFQALTVLPHLRALILERMPCTGIAALPDLEVLRLGRTRLALAELTGLPKLRRLVLDQRLESDLSVLATLPSLKELELVNMPWADLTPFQARPDIKVVQS